LPFSCNTISRGPLASAFVVYFCDDERSGEPVLDRVPARAPERQADVAHVVELMEEQDHSTVRLTDEQLAEVRRRRAKKNVKHASLAVARGRFRNFVPNVMSMSWPDTQRERGRWRCRD
jgi:hypothetical protein